MDERRVLRWLVLAVALVVGPTAATTSASADAYTYDAPALACLDADASALSDTDQSQLSDHPEGAAVPSVEAWGTSTTPPHSFIATEAAEPGTALVKYEPYPPEATSPRGFLGGSVRDTLQPGTVISRYGGEGGTFASPAGTPFSARGLPPGYEALGESRYVFAQPLEVDAGIAAYWQGGGGGIQYDLPSSIADLVNQGILKRLP